MPNWCYNEIDIKGSKKDLQRFKEETTNEEGYFSFATLVPLPKGIDGEEQVEWCKKNWGTKWDVDNDDQGSGLSPIEKEKGKNVVSAVLMTAWSPPAEWLRKASKKFPSLSFEYRYAEPEMDFAGESQFMAGKVILDKELEVDEVLQEF